MNTTKLIVATATAFSVMGAITLAYAQTTSPAASAPTSGMPQPMSDATQTPQTPQTDSTLPNRRANAGTMNAPSSGAPRDTTTNPSRSTMPSDGSAMPMERAARTDRN